LVDDGSCIKVQKYVSSSSGDGGDGGDRGAFLAPGATYQEGDYVEVSGDVVTEGDGYVLSATTEPFPLEETKPILPAPLKTSYADLRAIKDDILAHLSEFGDYHYIPNPWGYEIPALFAYLYEDGDGFFTIPGIDSLDIEITFAKTPLIANGSFYDTTLYFTSIGTGIFTAGVAAAKEFHPDFTSSTIKNLNDTKPLGEFFTLKGVVLATYIHFFLLDDGGERIIVDNNFGKTSPAMPVTGNVVEVTGFFSKADLMSHYAFFCADFVYLSEKITVNIDSTDLTASAFSQIAQAWSKGQNPDWRVSIRYTIHNLKIGAVLSANQLSTRMLNSDDGKGNNLYVIVDGVKSSYSVGEILQDAVGYLINYDGAGFYFLLSRYNGVGPESGFTDVAGFNAMAYGVTCSLDVVVMGYWDSYTLLFARDASGMITINWGKNALTVDGAALQRGAYIHVEGTKHGYSPTSDYTLPNGDYLALSALSVKTETAPVIDLSWTPGRTLTSRAELYALPSVLEPVVTLFKNVTLLPDSRYFGYFSVENNENIEFEIDADVYDFSAIDATLKYAVADVSGILVTYPSASHPAVILLTGVDIKETHTSIDVEITVVDSINVTSFDTPDGGLVLYLDAFQNVTPNYPFIQQVHPALVYYSDSACTVTIADLPFSFYLVNSNHYALDANPTAYKTYIKDGYYDADFYAKITFPTGEGNQSYRVKNATHVVIHVPVKN
jgi:hypothetical protein